VKSSRAGQRLSLAALLAAASLAAAADVPLPRAELHSGAHTFDVEVAATPAQRARGLMGRTHLSDGAGMLFVFEAAERHCFWMKDTPLPLSIAFLNDAGTVVGTADMQPETTELHCAAEPVRYALEVRQGTFRDNGIGPGGRFEGWPFGAPP
jgi:uncharacterized membrane protein (UPF0127 family)